MIEIEYADNGRRWFTKACRDHGDRWSIVYRDRNLRHAGYAAPAAYGRRADVGRQLG